MSSYRLACLEVPLFPLAARLRSEPELGSRALVLLSGFGPAARVVAASRQARRSGIRPGMSLAEARSRCPDLVTRQQEPRSEHAAREALLDVAESFSTRVEDGGPGVVFLDAEGFAGDGTPASEERLGRSLMLAVEKQAGLPARLGIASSRLAARLAASASGAVIAAGDEAGILAPMAIDRIASGEMLEKLKRRGVATLGELAELPDAEVTARLGGTGGELRALARGEDPRPLVPRQPPPVFLEGIQLETVVFQLDSLGDVVRGNLERLTRRLKSHGLACQRLEIELGLEPAHRYRRSLALAIPTRDVETLLALSRRQLESRPPGAPVAAVTLTAHPDRPRTAQLDLFGPPALLTDRLATAMARISSVVGKDRVDSPRPARGRRPGGPPLAPARSADPAPETDPAEATDPAAATHPATRARERRVMRRGRGLLAMRRLRPALPLEVLTREEIDARSAGSASDARSRPTPQPDFIKTRSLAASPQRPQIQGQVRTASGPWNLEDDWWRKTASGERDYWEVELPAGALYRIFRDRGSGDWFADGVYD